MSSDMPSYTPSICQSSDMPCGMPSICQSSDMLSGMPFYMSCIWVCP